MKKKVGKFLATGGLLLSLSAPSHAFFNPFGMMGNMMGMMAKPVTDQMIGDMLGTMQGLMHNNEFRNDMALFMLGTANEAIFEMMVSIEKQEPTFIGAMAESMLTNGAPKGSAEYNAAMGHWMTVFGPAMQARMEVEQEQAALEQAIEDEIDRRRQLGVFVARGDYNWDTHSYDPDYLAYRDRYGNTIEYIPEVDLPGDPGYQG
ncbi:MAG: hypothetical protein ACWA5Q_10985 [bacterium]